MSKILEAAISRAVTLGSGVKDEEAITGMIVGICGPIGLADSVTAEVGKVDPTRRDQVGGIEIHDEYVSLIQSVFFADLARYRSFAW